jgi:hypothetical protein
MTITDHENQDLIDLVNWYFNKVTQMSDFSLHEVCQMLLCAKDLGLRSYSLDRALIRVINSQIPFENQRKFIVDTLIRQIVLIRYDVSLEERKTFLDYWIEKKNYSGEEIITVTYILSIAIEQQVLLSPKSRLYVQEWFIKHPDIESKRVKSWVPHYLVLSNYKSEAIKIAMKLLGERNKNGSWGGDLRGTTGIAYALAYSKVFDPSDFKPTIRYIRDKLSRGFSGQVSHEAAVLKLFYRLDVIPSDILDDLRTRLANENSVFLSHSSSDKQFVRQLANHIKAEGIRCWLDEAEIKPGDSIVAKIQDGINEMRYLLVVISQNSIRSAWVEKELNAALMVGLSKRSIKVIPILKDTCDIPLLLRDIQYADFRNSFSDGFAQLMRTLSQFEVSTKSTPG